MSSYSLKKLLVDGYGQPLTADAAGWIAVRATDGGEDSTPDPRPPPGGNGRESARTEAQGFW
jgi:hypothetical protein